MEKMTQIMFVYFLISNLFHPPIYGDNVRGSQNFKSKFAEYKFTTHTQLSIHLSSQFPFPRAQTSLQNLAFHITKKMKIQNCIELMKQIAFHIHDSSNRIFFQNFE